MADPITVQFTPTPQDYVRTYRALQFRHPATRLVYALLTAFELCLVASLFISRFESNSSLWVAAIPIPLLLLLAVMWPGYNVGRNARHNERLLAEITWEFNDERVRTANRFAETKYDWGSFQDLVENKEYFFLRHSANKRLYNFIPKRAFTSDGQMAAFRDLFDHHAGAKRQPAASAPANG